MEVGFARTNSGVATNKNNNSEVFWAFLGYIPDASRRNKPVVFTTSPHNQSHYFISPRKQLHDIKTGHITNHITSSHPASNFMTSKQVTSPPWNRRLVHSKEMVGASRVHVADHLSLKVQRHIRDIACHRRNRRAFQKSLLTHFALDRSWPIDQWDSRWQKNKQDGKVKNAKAFP